MTTFFFTNFDIVILTKLCYHGSYNTSYQKPNSKIRDDSNFKRKVMTNNNIGSTFIFKIIKR